MRLAIYDIDGTLTQKGYPFWDLITLRVLPKNRKLQKYLEKWSAGYTDRLRMEEKEFVLQSKKMMEQCIRLDSTIRATEIRRIACEITLDLIKKDVVLKAAIEQVRQDLASGWEIVFSTGSYFDGACGFLDGLVDGGLLSKAEAGRIEIRGVTVDWEHSTVLFMNVGSNKAATGKDLQKYVSIKVYGDDPFGNDKGLFSLTTADKRFVIPGKVTTQDAIEGFARLHRW